MIAPDFISRHARRLGVAENEIRFGVRQAGVGAVERAATAEALRMAIRRAEAPIAKHRYRPGYSRLRN
jgi:hypothetical protein